MWFYCKTLFFTPKLIRTEDLTCVYISHSFILNEISLFFFRVKPTNFIEQFCLPVDVTFDLNDLSSHMIWPKMPSCLAVLASLRSAVHITTDAG